MTGEAPDHEFVSMTRDEALATLAKTTGSAGDGEHVGPQVEAVVARIRAGEPIEDAELNAVLALLQEHLTEVQRLIFGVAHVRVGTYGNGKPRYRAGWYEVGLALGFPSRTAHMRALGLARKVGLGGKADQDASTDDTD